MGRLSGRRHFLSGLYGELYYRSTLPFLSEEATRREVEYLSQAFQSIEPGSPILDIGCGHGRHASLLGQSRRMVGVDIDGYSLERRLPGFEAILANFFQLPFSNAYFQGAYAWYSSLCTFREEENADLFREIARVLAPGARLILHTVPFEFAAQRPDSRFEGVLDDGCLLLETSRFIPSMHRDEVMRRLVTPDGRTLEATFFIRYFSVPELTTLLNDAGLSVEWVHGGLDGSSLNSRSTELIVGAVRNHE